MPNASGRKGNPDGKRLAAIDQLLMAGMKLGPAKKQEAVNKVLALVPEWTRLDCWQRIRRLRRISELGPQERDRYKAKKSEKTGPIPRSSRARWTLADDDRLLKAQARHPRKGCRWIKQKYFERVGTRDWWFFGNPDEADGWLYRVRLFHASSVKIVRHVQVRSGLNPYDPLWKPYLLRRTLVAPHRTRS